MQAPNIIISGSSTTGLSRRQASLAEEVKAAGFWLVIVRRNGFRDVGMDDVDWIENLVTTEGLNYYLDCTLKTGLAAPAWYMGLTDGTPTAAAGDTMSSHAGWTEVTAYDEATREVWTPGAIAAGSVDNSGAPAQFTISADSTTTGGAFLVSNSTKGGATGTLQAVGAFTAGDKSLDDNDTLDVTATFTQAAA